MATQWLRVLCPACAQAGLRRQETIAVVDKSGNRFGWSIPSRRARSAKRSAGASYVEVAVTYLIGPERPIINLNGDGRPKKGRTSLPAECGLHGRFDIPVEWVADRLTDDLDRPYRDTPRFVRTT